MTAFDLSDRDALHEAAAAVEAEAARPEPRPTDLAMFNRVLDAHPTRMDWIPKPMALVGRGHAALRARATEVELPATVENIRLAFRLDKTLTKHWPGLAIAAPQVGVPLRMVVLPGHAIANPSIMRGAEIVEAAEGCLSLPGRWYRVPRSTTCIVHGFNLGGEPIRYEASGVHARAWQHELDHLDGILICDHYHEVPAPTKLRSPTVEQELEELDQPPQIPEPVPVD